jgi:hypothetical protein
MNLGFDLLRCANFRRHYLPPHFVSVWMHPGHDQIPPRLSSMVILSTATIVHGKLP